jgi:Domain of unknown function (DUF4375)
MMDKNNFLIQLSESTRTSFGKVDFNSQSEDQKVFSAIWTLESEVNNGGFLQYFENDRGETASFAVTALQRIGANRCADIVQRSIRAVCDNTVPSDAHRWEVLIEAITDESAEKLEGLDLEFFKYPDNLTELLFEFVREYPEDFGPIEAE